MRGGVTEMLVAWIGQKDPSGEIEDDGAGYDEQKTEKHPLLVEDLEHVPEHVEVDEQQQQHPICLVTVRPQTGTAVYHAGQGVEDGADPDGEDADEHERHEEGVGDFHEASSFGMPG
jgi:hypothetical protein